MSDAWTITVTPPEAPAAPEGARAGDAGFEWGPGYHESGGGLTFTKVGPFVFAWGYAYYTGPFAPNSLICALGEGWRDNIGVDALVFANGDPAKPVGIYASPTGLHAGNGDGLPDDGYLSIQAFWVAA